MQKATVRRTGKGTGGMRPALAIVIAVLSVEGTCSGEMSSKGPLASGLGTMPEMNAPGNCEVNRCGLFEAVG